MEYISELPGDSTGNGFSLRGRIFDPLGESAMAEVSFFWGENPMLRSKSAAWSLVSAFTLMSAAPSPAQSPAQTSPLEVSSPDHRITMRFALKPGKDAAGPDGQLVYSVEFEGKQVFEDSALKLELANQPPLGSAIHITGTTPGSGVDDYTLLAGKTSAVHDGI
jgi:hypothetical protein